MLLLLAATIGVVACTGVEDSAETPEQKQSAEPQAVSFSAYLNRGTTRGGATGVLTTDAMQTAGFGVFAYYTDSHLYNQLSLPNFMYNQQVTYSASSWNYSPVKYWPNETGPSASSAEVDRLTFFAYAPFTEVDAVTGRATTNPTTGIVAVARPVDSGDPTVRYYASWNPAEAVDLCWSNTNNVDKIKPNVSENVNFNFKHALSALNVQIDADVDVTSHPGGAVDGNTRIYVRSITFRGFADKGQLNLNNTRQLPAGTTWTATAT